MKFKYNDGGREASGYKGKAGDCVARSIAIVAGLPYQEVYDALANGAGNERLTKGKSARNGIHVKRKWFKDYMAKLGFKWTPTMLIGQGCKVHLKDGELPMGRLVVSLSKHYTAVINSVVQDTFDPQRKTYWYGTDGKVSRISERCVYGYWQKEVA